VNPNVAEKNILILVEEKKNNLIQSFSLTLCHLIIGCFSEPDKIKLFKGWYISNVREMVFPKLSQRVDTCFKT
jgi:hypothetical protein